VTIVTGHSSNSPLFFGLTILSKKLHSVAIVGQARARFDAGEEVKAL